MHSLISNCPEIGKILMRLENLGMNAKIHKDIQCLASKVRNLEQNHNVKEKISKDSSNSNDHNSNYFDTFPLSGFASKWIKNKEKSITASNLVLF